MIQNKKLITEMHGLMHEFLYVLQDFLGLCMWSAGRGRT